MSMAMPPDQSLYGLPPRESFLRKLTLTEPAASTVLSELCKRGDVTSVRTLLDAGADVNGYDTANNFPLFSSASHGQLEILPLLLEFGANLGQKSRGDGFTALHAAASNGHLAIVQALIDAGADVNVTSHAGSTPAMMAARG